MNRKVHWWLDSNDGCLFRKYEYMKLDHYYLGYYCADELTGDLVEVILHESYPELYI